MGKVLFFLSLTFVGVSVMSVEIDKRSTVYSTDPFISYFDFTSFDEDVLDYHRGAWAEGVIKSVVPHVNVPEEKIKAMIIEAINQYIRENRPAAVRQRTYQAFGHHLTPAEIAHFMKFYDTPEGRKIVEALPQIIKEARQSQWGWALSISHKLKQNVEGILSSLEIKNSPTN